jgi:hypothetical protein
MKFRLVSASMLLSLVMSSLVGCSSLAQNQTPAALVSPAPTSSISELESKFGIQIVSTKLSGNNYLVDVRYRVVDGDKARPILDKTIKPALVHVQTGDRFYVPTQPIVGPLRQTVNKSRPVIEDRVYFLLFANPNQKLKIGDQVTLAIGEFSKSNLEIQ